MPDFAADHDVVTPLTEQECWSFLGEHAFGRLAYSLLDEVQIVPINYVSDHGGVYFRTAEGSKLLGITMNASVVFEVDDLDGVGAGGSGRFGDGEAASVIVRGTAEVLEGEARAHAEQLPLRPWLPTEKHTIVRIGATEISGRRFQLSKPWRHMHPGA